MRNFVARSGRSLLLTSALLLLPLAFALAEGEAPGGTGGAAGTESSDNNLGIGLFSRMPFNISASVSGGYDDNVSTTTTSQVGSGFVTAGLAVAYNLGSQRTNLTLSSNIGFTYYSALDTDPFEPNLNLALNLSHKVSPRLTLAASGVFAYQTEPDFHGRFGNQSSSWQLLFHAE